MIFLFPWWDMLVSWRVHQFRPGNPTKYSKIFKNDDLEKGFFLFLSNMPIFDIHVKKIRGVWIYALFTAATFFPK